MVKQGFFRSTFLALASVVVLVSLLVTSLLSLELLRRAQDLAKHTHQVRHALEMIRATVLDAETDQRGFLLTGDERHLAEHRLALTRQKNALATLGRLVAPNAAQFTNLQQLRGLMDRRIEEQKRTIEARQAGDAKLAVLIVRANTDRRTGAIIYDLLKKMDDEELRLLDEGSLATKRRYQLVFAVVTGCSLLLFALGVLIFLINRDIRRRQDLEVSLTEALRREKEVRQDAEEAHAVALRSEDLQKRRARQALMAADTAIALTEAGPLGDLLRRSCEAAVRHLDATFARIWTVTSEGTHLELQASAGLYTHVDGEHRRVPVGQFKIGMVAAERKPHLTNDVSNDPRVADRAWASREGLVSFAGYPLLVEDRLVGVLAMFARHPLSDDTLDTLASIANSIGVGIERKRVETEIRESEQRYRFLADAIPNQVWTALPDGSLDYVNRRVCEYFDRSFDELIGVGWIEMVHPEDVASCIARWSHSLGTGEPYEVEFRLRWSTDGTYRAHMARALPFRGPNGQILKWFGTNTDISERKRDEEERERLYQQAQRAVRSRDDLLATVSHDLRSPLSTILMGTAMLKRFQTGAPPERIVKHSNAIERAAEQMNRLIGDLLDLAAIESGHLSIDVQTHDAGSLVADAIELAQPLARDKGLVLVDGCGGDHLFVQCDRDRIAQVFANLIGNAIKFTAPGGTITVKCQSNIDPHPSQVRFSVADTGSGIEPDELPRVFDRFWQAKETEKAGTGLGLAICQGIIAQHRSTIHVQSTKSVGTTFSFGLPSGSDATVATVSEVSVPA